MTHHLEVAARVVTPLELDEQSGSALRGAMSNALWDGFCANKEAPTCVQCPLVKVCPVAALVAPMREEEEQGGSQRPRPYVVRPPREGGRRYAPGDRLVFGLGLFGAAADLFPYVVLGVDRLERGGLGRKLGVNGGRRGRLEVEEIAAVHPLRRERQVLYKRGQRQVEAPGLPVSPGDVAAFAAGLPTDRLTLECLTPLRLIDNQQLVKRLTLRPLLQRLMRRLDELCIAYGEGPLGIDFQGLLAQAQNTQVHNDTLQWVDVVSFSGRQGRSTPIGGLRGRITFEGDLAALRELLVWGSLVHVGRNAVKGDGWYRIEQS